MWQEVVCIHYAHLDILIPKLSFQWPRLLWTGSSTTWFWLATAHTRRRSKRSISLVANASWMSVSCTKSAMSIRSSGKADYLFRLGWSTIALIPVHSTRRSNATITSWTPTRTGWKGCRELHRRVRRSCSIRGRDRLILSLHTNYRFEFIDPTHPGYRLELQAPVCIRMLLVAISI